MAQNFIAQASDFRKVLRKKTGIPMLRFKFTWGLEAGDNGEPALLTSQTGCLAQLDHESEILSWAPPLATGPFGRSHQTTEHSPELLRLGIEALVAAHAKELLQQWGKEYRMSQDPTAW